MQKQNVHRPFSDVFSCYCFRSTYHFHAFGKCFLKGGHFRVIKYLTTYPSIGENIWANKKNWEKDLVQKGHNKNDRTKIAYISSVKLEDRTYMCQINTVIVIVWANKMNWEKDLVQQGQIKYDRTKIAYIGRQPWSSCYGRRRVLNVVGSNPSTVYWMEIFTLISCKICNVCLKKDGK